MKFIIFILLILFSMSNVSGTVFAQSTEAAREDKQESKLLSKSLSMGGVGLTHGILYTYAYFAWYKGRTLTDELIFRDEGFFGVDTYAGGADKFGHMFSNYTLTRGTTQILRRGGWSQTTSVSLSASLSLAFFTLIEFKDGYHANFGFAWGDMVANVTGIGLAVLMETVPWFDRHFDIRLEYLPTALFIEQLREDGIVNAAEDYSGQTFLLSYHLSAHPGLLQKPLEWLRYVDLTAGFGTHNYLPEPKDPNAVKEQEVFIGVSLNVQEVIDQVFFKPEKRHGIGYKSQRFATEVLAIPYTTLPLVWDTRHLEE